MIQQPVRAQRTASGASAVTEPADRLPEHDSRDNLRHIVCVLCYPRFRGTQAAPHDAFCVCGKPLRTGDVPNPPTSAQCILCDELWDHHCDVVHPGD